MFCKYCGEKNKKDNRFCISCGSCLKEDIQNEIITNKIDNDYSKIKIISIIGLVICFIPFINIIGIVLSIIGLIMNNKYKRENGVSQSFYALNIIGIIISVIEILIILFIILIVFLSASLYNKSYIGKWYCSSYSNLSYKYDVEAEFKDNGTFYWGKYGDVKNNSFLGTYTVYKKDIDEYDKKYSMDLNIDSYILDGKKQSDLSGLYKKLYTNMYITDDSSIIKINTTNKTYYCKKVKEN